MGGCDNGREGNKGYSVEEEWKWEVNERKGKGNGKKKGGYG